MIAEDHRLDDDTGAETIGDPFSLAIAAVPWGCSTNGTRPRSPHAAAARDPPLALADYVLILVDEAVPAPVHESSLP